jgi:hypothetical protein
MRYKQCFVGMWSGELVRVVKIILPCMDFACSKRIEIFLATSVPCQDQTSKVVHTWYTHLVMTMDKAQSEQVYSCLGFRVLTISYCTLHLLEFSPCSPQMVSANNSGGLMICPAWRLHRERDSLHTSIPFSHLK